MPSRVDRRLALATADAVFESRREGHAPAHGNMATLVPSLPPEGRKACDHAVQDCTYEVRRHAPLQDILRQMRGGVK